MKAVILASGKGTRMGDVAKYIPKPLLTISGKTLLEYKIDILPQEFDEVILMIGHLGEKIRNHFGERYKGRKITYIESEILGTGYTLFQAQKHLNDRFIVMCGDDLYSKKDIEECLKHPRSALIFKTSLPQSGGKVVLDSDGLIETIVEGSHEAGISIATGLYVLDPEIFKLPLVQANNGKNEFGLPQTLLQLRNETKDKRLKAVFATAWHQVTAPQDLELDSDKLAAFL